MSDTKERADAEERPDATDALLAADERDEPENRDTEDSDAREIDCAEDSVFELCDDRDEPDVVEDADEPWEAV